MTQHTTQNQPQIIGIGATANDGTGDNMRIAAEKINTNFTDVYTAVNSITEYTLLPATTAILGGVVVDGTSISVDSTGVISSTILGAGPGTDLPEPDGPVAITGVSPYFARQDHVHPECYPSGIISMWYGDIGTIPSGWVLCDGTMGTPDLRDRFVIGAGGVHVPHAMGGRVDSIVVDHSHTATSLFTGTTMGTHTHAITDPSHQHEYYISGDETPFASGSTNGLTNPGVTLTDTSSATTGISVNAKSAGKPAGIIETTISSTGGSATGSNLPPYYALAFIMSVY